MPAILLPCVGPAIAGTFAARMGAMMRSEPESGTRGNGKHWRKPSAKRKTSLSTARWRRQQRKIETDKGRPEVGPSPIVSTAERSVAIVAAESPRMETPDGIDLDGHRSGPDDHARDRDGGAERYDLQGAACDAVRGSHRA